MVLLNWVTYNDHALPAGYFKNAFYRHTLTWINVNNLIIAKPGEIQGQVFRGAIIQLKGPEGG